MSNNDKVNSVQYPRSVLIVGGGTAGWMAANILAVKWPDCKVTLVESKDIGVIGVGEGSTPYLKSFFSDIGVSEKEWMEACCATYKLGIEFEGWTSFKQNNSYFHPFYSAYDKPSAELFFYNCGLRRRGNQADTNPANYFVSAEMVNQKFYPNKITNKEVDIDYGYHFDSVLLGRFLRDIAKSRGITHIVDDVTDVRLSTTGEISTVNTITQRQLSADFYIDCSGFRAKLIHQSLGEQYCSYQDQLFNDSAVALQIPTNDLDNTDYVPQTRSVALKYGWMWDIPLTTRTGRGYVYSSKYVDKTEAEKELREVCGVANRDDITARHLKMRVGRLHNHWSSNCLAVGLSQGFIEPLEATALMLTQYTMDQFIGQYSNNCSLAQEGFNNEINRMFDGVRDYIVAHYALTDRSDTAYWIDNREQAALPVVLSKIRQAWESGADVEQTLSHLKQQLVYLRPSWYCILAGMGCFTKTANTNRPSANPEEAIAYCKSVIARLI